jgi:hypothetical protein
MGVRRADVLEQARLHTASYVDIPLSKRSVLFLDLWLLAPCLFVFCFPIPDWFMCSLSTHREREVATFEQSKDASELHLADWRHKHEANAQSEFETRQQYRQSVLAQVSSGNIEQGSMQQEITTEAHS